MKRKIYKIIPIICCILACIAISFIIYPYIEKLSKPQYQAEINRFIKSLGIGGPLLLIFVQFIQVIIAFIPGGPFEILTGVLYGAYGGLIICLIGSVSASALIFKLSKKYGKRILYFFFSKEKIAKWEWLKDSRKTDIVVFILFLIPGTPKDMLTYIVGIGDIGLLKFIIISSLARIPALFSSALIGTTMRQGDIKSSLLIFVITGIVGITGICIKDTVLKKYKSEKKTIEKLQGLDILQTIYMDRLYCRYIKEMISEDVFYKIHSKAQRYGLSVNDVFVAVYGNVMCDRLKQSHITIPCPVNLRNFTENKTLTVANMTGMYHIPAVSYSNIGIIDCNKLTFNEHISECFLSSAYRHTPDFQLTISTYNNVCTLTCSTFDNADNCIYGMDILKSVKNRLLQWVDI